MIAVRYIALAALVVWVGVMIALPILAPAVHGSAIGEVWRRDHQLAYACGGTVFVSLFAMKFLGPPPRAFALRAAIVFVMLLLVAYSGRHVGTNLPAPLATLNVGLGLFLLFWYVRE